MPTVDRWEKVARELMRKWDLHTNCLDAQEQCDLFDSLVAFAAAAHDEGQREGRAGHHESCAALRLDAEGGPSRLRCDCRCQANGCFAFMTDNDAEKPCGAGCWRIRRARASNIGSPR